MPIGRFDSDVQALKQRIVAHDKYSARDLNTWIFEHLALNAGLTILELGCGIGKQTLPMAKITTPSGHIFAVDIAPGALESLNQSSKALGLDQTITPILLGLDDLYEGFQPETMDRVLASYSLYYVERPQRVIQEIHRVLKPGGILFFCGPAHANNAEIKQFIGGVAGKPLAVGTKASRFMEETGQQITRKLFSRMEIFTFENPLRFDSAEALLGYWSCHNLYDENLAGAFQTACQAYFRDHDIFETTKRVIGVRATK